MITKCEHIDEKSIDVDIFSFCFVSLLLSRALASHQKHTRVNVFVLQLSIMYGRSAFNRLPCTQYKMLYLFFHRFEHWVALLFARNIAKKKFLANATAPSFFTSLKCEQKNSIQCVIHWNFHVFYPIHNGDWCDFRHFSVEFFFFFFWREGKLPGKG